MSNEHIDYINKKTMHHSVSEYAESQQDGLTKSENAALDYVKDAVDKPILDIGIGGGRTVEALLQISKDYVGIDYVDDMVVECKQKYPDVNFKQGDARKLSSFQDNSFQTIMFSMNGISMVDHKGRIDILNEVYRLLSPGGAFLFSTYNLDNKVHMKFFQPPKFIFSTNPLRLVVRSLRYAKNSLISMINRFRYKRLEIQTNEYSIVNDICHNYATMLYYITYPNQIKQLTNVGFDSSVVAFDLSGNVIETETQSNSIFYVARKPS